MYIEKHILFSKLKSLLVKKTAVYTYMYRIILFTRIICVRSSVVGFNIGASVLLAHRASLFSLFINTLIHQGAINTALLPYIDWRTFLSETHSSSKK